MNTVLTSIFDKKAAAYLPPLAFDNLASAIRGYTMAVRDPKTNFCQFASDYDLVQLGTFHSESGEIHLFDIQFVCNLQSLKGETNEKT